MLFPHLQTILWTRSLSAADDAPGPLSCAVGLSGLYPDAPVDERSDHFHRADADTPAFIGVALVPQPCPSVGRQPARWHLTSRPRGNPSLASHDKDSQPSNIVYTDYHGNKKFYVTPGKQTKDALRIAVAITKSAARGGYNKTTLATVLKEVYQTVLELRQPSEPPTEELPFTEVSPT